ncbi:discoidin domain-containing protein [Maribellus sp. CM-23]|uniref:galactose-binding domain-containing protein n=1 Tax=Maribellus sp. CM-23 TaxID=2781026 RepID=UPI001F2E1BBA|nr:discoidin domain-containing protein [Maribellus sp. CM-23]MCE4566415.1 discoidin domain-containing protein [Maribellus sp. CM-23]
MRAYAQDVSVFVCAHPYDWQLFMNPNAYQSLKQNGEKTIFIHLTSGDEGNGISNNLYLAKEEGSKRGVRHMSNTFASGSGIGANMDSKIIKINNHNINCSSYRNGTMFFLRLPDAKHDGEGYPVHSNSSIQKLYKSEIDSIEAIDKSSTYTSVEDLKATLKEMIGTVANSDDLINFHMIDDSLEINPGIHSDRLYTSKIFFEIARESDFYTLYMYKSQSSAVEGKNVSGNNLLNNFGAWSATCSGVTDLLFRSGWGAQNNLLLERQYYRYLNPFNVENENIALNKPSSSSSFESNNESFMAVDGSLETWWGANPHGEWWMVDLESEYSISRINVVNYFHGQRIYRFNIESSVDNEDWTKVVDYDANNTYATSEGKNFRFKDLRSRYLKVNMTYNSANIGVHITEFRAYGSLITGVDEMKTGPGKNIRLYPNPVRLGNSIKLEVDSERPKLVTVKVLDSCGSKVSQYTKSLNTGINTLEILTGNFNGGIYFVHILQGNEMTTEKVIIH